MLEVKNKKVQRSEWNCEEFPPPQMSGSWCDRLNEGENNLTRRKRFL